jgi:3-methyladenine DNA glycosylase/8-oxoguanine DNA glycosylase
LLPRNHSETRSASFTRREGTASGCSHRVASDVIEATFRPAGPYDLRRMRRDGLWRAALPGGRVAVAWQRHDGAVTVRATDGESVERARFMLALDADHSGFHRAFGRDPLLGPSLRGLYGLRPLRTATVAHALLRAACGQLVSGSTARQVEGSILRLAGSRAPTGVELARLSPAELRARGLATYRASALVRVLKGGDLERLHGVPSAVVIRRLGRERGFGPWSSGVVCLEGLGRYDHGKVGDLALIKLMSSLQGRWVEAAETAELVAPYGEWRGLAALYLMAGYGAGLVPGADRDGWREPRRQAAAGRAA